MGRSGAFYLEPQGIHLSEVTVPQCQSASASAFSGDDGAHGSAVSFLIRAGDSVLVKMP